MKDISEIDKNFKVETTVEKDDVVFYDVNKPPFCVHGLIYQNNKFRRMPEEVAKTVSEGVYALHTNTAGGRVRFKTNSKYVVINAKMSNIRKMAHCAQTGSAGFDLYTKTEGFIKSFIPPFDIENGYESIIEFGTEEFREYTINFPTYSDVNDLYIGLAKNATVLKPEPYAVSDPIVYYGSSITQGGCVSRPGNAYQNIISREFNADFINLGWSGKCLAENEMAEYIKNLKMSAFVFDYDHNAPTLDHFSKTHEPLFKKVRAANPTLPIIIMTRPKYNLDSDDLERQRIAKQTYINAKQNGDNNVYFLGGKDLMNLAKIDGTVDGIHPTDFGFASMAEALKKVFNSIFVK